jgi:hypothetical protein
MLCLRRVTLYMLWLFCRDASPLQHLTASFDSFAEQRSVAGAPKIPVWVVRLSDGGIVAIT